MKRLLAGVFALALLCSCAQAAMPTLKAKKGGAALDSLPVKLTFAVESGSGGILRSAAEKFGRRAAILSRGQLDISVASSDDVFAALDSGEASIILAGNAAASARSPFFAIAAENFRYGSYEEFTMTLNAEKTLRALSSASRAHVFAAYYTGSNVFAGGDTPDGTLFVSREESTEASGKQLGIYTVEDSGTDAALALPGFVVAEVINAQERLNAIFEPDKLAELRFDEISPATLEAAHALYETGLHKADEGLGETEKPNELTRVVITRSFHSAAPAWLALAPHLYENLPERERAALSEAAAYLAGEIDNAYLSREEARLNELAELSEPEVTVSGQLAGMRSTRRRITRARNSAAANLPDSERAFVGLLNSVY